ncbi:MAG: helix-turn-helix transcriptional regulator [Merismopedia sp. SIO2A8]|nr:helix-turn-helix transcriptional regulator [Symploca sp. SIO2B6]NET49721.1 helix-turn-helix transcriptional regulator [Merismopedia sp. SIO2A8]
MDMRTLRRQTRLSTGAVARHLEISESTVRNWEKGRSTPRLDLVKTLHLCRLYNCSLEQLVDAYLETKEGAA